MKKTLLCPAKINLFLEITGKREDSYHTLDMVMHTVSLADTVSVSVRKGEGKIKLDSPARQYMPLDNRNIAYRAADKYMSVFGIKGYDVDIVIDKKIPVCAGLGGGSADGAGVLRALESIFSAKDKSELDKLALSLGADLPFCMYGGCMRALGIGEQLSPVAEMPKDTVIVIAKGKNGVSTAAAYAETDNEEISSKRSADEIIKALEKGGNSFEKHLFNRFEDTVFRALPEIPEIKKDLLSSGADAALMSGSGSALFAFFRDRKNASDACEKLRDRGIFACMASPFSREDF